MSWHIPVTILLGTLAIPLSARAGADVQVSTWTTSTCRDDSPDGPPDRTVAVDIDQGASPLSLALADRGSGCRSRAIEVTSHTPVVVSVVCDGPGPTLSLRRAPSPWTARETSPVYADEGVLFGIPEGRSGLFLTARVSLTPGVDQRGTVVCDLVVERAYGSLPQVQEVPARTPMVVAGG